MASCLLPADTFPAPSVPATANSTDRDLSKPARIGPILNFGATMLLPVLFAVTMAATDGTARIETQRCEFGEVYQGQPASCLVEFVNPGDAPVRLVDLTAKIRSDSVAVPSLLVPARGTAHAELKIDTSNDAGTSHHVLGYRIDGQERDYYVDSVGFVANVFDVSRLSIDLGPVGLTEKDRKGGSLRLNSDEDPDARVDKVISAPDYLKLSIDKDGRGLSVAVADSAPWGLLDVNVILGLHSARQQRLSVKIKADVRGPVVPAANPLELDIVRRGAGPRDYLIPLQQAGDRPLRVGSVRLDGIEGSAAVADCLPAAANCRWIRLKVSDQQPLGYLKGELRIELPDYSRTLPVQVWGVMVGEKTVIKDIAEEMQKQADVSGVAAPDGGSSPAVGGGSLVQQIRQAATRARPDDPPGSGPVLRWEVANEGLLYGYHVYRADSADGPWRRIDVETIRVAPVENASGQYAWRDRTGEAGKTYWYYVGTVDHRGERKRLTSPMRATVKPKAE